MVARDVGTSIKSMDEDKDNVDRRVAEEASLGALVAETGSLGAVVRTGCKSTFDAQASHQQVEGVGLNTLIRGPDWQDTRAEIHAWPHQSWCLSGTGIAQCIIGELHQQGQGQG